MDQEDPHTHRDPRYLIYPLHDAVTHSSNHDIMIRHCTHHTSYRSHGEAVNPCELYYTLSIPLYHHHRIHSCEYYHPNHHQLCE
jgi:hypothetical protein